MSDTTPTHPQFIDVDFDQWRQEIKTFSSATQQSLRMIIDELSNQCSGQAASASSQAASPHSPPLPTPSPQMDQSEISHAATRHADVSVPTPSSAGDDRLSKLKQQLAKRLGKS